MFRIPIVLLGTAFLVGHTIAAHAAVDVLAGPALATTFLNERANVSQEQCVLSGAVADADWMLTSQLYGQALVVDHDQPHIGNSVDIFGISSFPVFWGEQKESVPSPGPANKITVRRDIGGQLNLPAVIVRIGGLPPSGDHGRAGFCLIPRPQATKGAPLHERTLTSALDVQRRNNCRNKGVYFLSKFRGPGEIARLFATKSTYRTRNCAAVKAAIAVGGLV